MPKNFDNRVLKKRIIEARERHNWSQAELAAKAKVTPAAISQIEKGNRTPTIPVLHRMANVLGESIDFLTGKTDKSEFADILQQDEFKTFFRGFRSLDVADQEHLKKYVEFLKTKIRQRKK